ncbi:glycosyltransferase [Candidatus Woesearchaeota archaeon]|nr:glycosyltransferase [Candidatus Woesearchaeota archaeon]
MLSIIIIAKNEEEFLPRLLKSIKAQDYDDYEIILSDAKSTDSTRDIAKSYGCKIVDGGLPSIGRNNGAKVAKGELLLFLDADVKMPEHFLKNTVAEFKKRNLATGTPLYKPITDKTIDKVLYDTYNIWAVATQHFYPHSAGFCIFSRKDVFNNLNGFDEDLLMAEDHDYVNRGKKYGKFRILKKSNILVDVRRLDKEGRFILAKKYLQGALHRTFKGEMHKPPFEYELHGGVEITKEIKKRDKKRDKKKFSK